MGRLGELRLVLSRHGPSMYLRCGEAEEPASVGGAASFDGEYDDEIVTG